MGSWVQRCAFFAVLIPLAACGTGESRHTSDVTAVPSAAVPAIDTITPGTAGDEAPSFRVLFVGDSLSEGYYASTVDQGFVEDLLAGWRKIGDVDDVRATVQGGRTWKMAKQVAPVAGGFDLVVLEAGANDVSETPISEFRRDYRALLEVVTVGSSDATVVCLGPWGPRRASAPYVRVVRTLCEDAGHGFGRLDDVYTERGTRGPSGRDTELGVSDDYHPNDLGHDLIARRVREVVAEVAEN